MKQKILAQLSTKYPGVSKQALGLIADRLAAKVTADDQIEGAITEFESVFPVTEFAATLQSEGDRRVTEAAKKPKPGKTKTETETGEAETEQGGDESKIDKLTSIVTNLATTVNGMLTNQTQKTVSEKFNAALAAKKLEVHPSFLKGRIPAKEEDLEAALAEVESDWNEFQQGLADKGMSLSTPPGSANTSSNAAVDAAIDKFVGAPAEGKK